MIAIVDKEIKKKYIILLIHEEKKLASLFCNTLYIFDAKYYFLPVFKELFFFYIHT